MDEFQDFQDSAAALRDNVVAAIEKSDMGKAMEGAAHHTRTFVIAAQIRRRHRIWQIDALIRATAVIDHRPVTPAYPHTIHMSLGERIIMLGKFQKKRYEFAAI